MSGIPVKCPKCGARNKWKEEINVLTSGIPAGTLGRVRLFTPRGLFAKPIKKAMGCYKVTYRCHKCGFSENYEIHE